MDRDLICGLMGLAIALVYIVATGDIPESGLGDSVGADGVPHILGYALASISAVFAIYRIIVLRGIAARTAPPEGVFQDPRHAFASAAGTVLICALFIFSFETLGYLLAVALLILALCLYQGVRFSPRVAAIAIGGSFILWLLFAQLLAVRMPAGFWEQLI